MGFTLKEISFVREMAPPELMVALAKKIHDLQLQKADVQSKIDAAENCLHTLQCSV